MTGLGLIQSTVGFDTFSPKVRVWFFPDQLQVITASSIFYELFAILASSISSIYLSGCLAIDLKLPDSQLRVLALECFWKVLG